MINTESSKIKLVPTDRKNSERSNIIHRQCIRKILNGKDFIQMMP